MSLREGGKAQCCGSEWRASPTAHHCSVRPLGRAPCDCLWGDTGSGCDRFSALCPAGPERPCGGSGRDMDMGAGPLRQHAAIV